VVRTARGDDAHAAHTIATAAAPTTKNRVTLRVFPDGGARTRGHR
jgi:hypothetical protein